MAQVSSATADETSIQSILTAIFTAEMFTGKVVF